MNYKITYTKRFIKNLKRLNAAERAQLKKKLEILEMDPLYPSLRTKRIRVQRKHGCAGHLAVRR